MRDLVYIFDVPIRAGCENGKTIKILACNTKNLTPQTFQLAKNSIKPEKDAPIIYTFSEVNEAMLGAIKACFSDDEYYIFKQPYLESSDAKLVTLFEKKSQYSKPTLFDDIKHNLQVQTFLCRFIFDDVSKFILHAGHLSPCDSLREAEKTIINEIFSFISEAKEFCQILVGDLGIPTLAKTGWSNSMAALTTPKISQPIWGRNQREDWEKRQFKYWEIGVSPYKLIAPTTGQLPDVSNMMGDQDVEALPLVSLFGEQHIELCSSLLKKCYSDSFSPGYNKSRQLLGNKIIEPLIAAGYKNKENGGISVHLACGAPHQKPYPVLHIPKKLWIKLGVFLNLNKNDVCNIIVKEDKDAVFLSSQPNGDLIIAFVANEVDRMAEYDFFKIENELPGLSISLFKNDSHDVFYQFNAEAIEENDSELASYLKDMPAQKLDSYKVTKLCGAITDIKRLNRSLLGLITANLFYESSPEGTSHFIKINFLNQSIANFILKGGYDSVTEVSYDINRPLMQHPCYQAGFLKEAGFLLIPINIFIGNFLKNLGQRGCKIIENSPYDIAPNTEKNAIVLQKPLPYALIKQYALSKRPTRNGYYFTYPTTKITCAEILAGLFEERFKFIKMLLQEVKISKALSVVINNDEGVLAVCESLVGYCYDQIEQRKENSKKSSPFDLFSAAKSDKRTDLLQESIRYYKENFEYTLQTKYRIENLQQLMNTQEKRMWVIKCNFKLSCSKVDKEPYCDYVRKNSALLLLKNYLILSHPHYTAAQVWASIKDKPVMYHGTGRHYQDKSGVDLTLENIIETVPSMKKCIQSLVTERPAVVDDGAKITHHS